MTIGLASALVAQDIDNTSYQYGFYDGKNASFYKMSAYANDNPKERTNIFAPSIYA